MEFLNAVAEQGALGKTAIAGTDTISVIVPVFNAMRYLPTTVPAIVQAAKQFGQSEIIFVDNGSTDGSFEYLQSIGGDSVRVSRREGASIAALRNHGARLARGEYISFLDADCVISEGYFGTAVGVLRSTGAVATGCEVHVPSAAHWIEDAWHHLHYVGRNRFVHYINSANFFMRRAVFLEIGGFKESLLTGEDAEIGCRITEAGHAIFESTGVGAIHLGNPKSVHQFYRRTVWHSLGMFGTVGWKRLDKPSVMMLAHFAASLAGLVALVFLPLPAGGAAAVALQLVVPATTVAFRCYQTGRIRGILPGLFLYWLYYWARIQALVLIVSRNSSRYRK